MDKITKELVKAHNHGFMQGMCCALVSLGDDNDMPTIAKNIAVGFGVGHISFYTGHGIDKGELIKLERILTGKPRPTKAKEAGL